MNRKFNRVTVFPVFVNADTLVFHYSDGSIGKLVNPFKFPDPGTLQ